MRAALLALTLAACAADVPRPTAIDANRTNIPLARLEQGRAAYLDKCTRCHTAIGPREILAGDWPGHVANMAERSKIDADEQQIITDYLVTVAPPGQTPVPASVKPAAAATPSP